MNESSLYVEPKKEKFREIENRVVVTRGWEWGKQGDIAQRVQTPSYKINNVVTIANNTVSYISYSRKETVKISYNVIKLKLSYILGTLCEHRRRAFEFSEGQKCHGGFHG